MYRAHDTRLERTVAIKILPPQLRSDPDRRLRFEREARAISSLKHPHVCTPYDVGREGETDFLVKEHLEGETLSERLDRRAPARRPVCSARGWSEAGRGWLEGASAVRGWVYRRLASSTLRAGASGAWGASLRKVW